MHRYRLFLTVLTIASLPVAILLAVGIGSESVGPADVLGSLGRHILGADLPETVEDQIVWGLRLPRALLATLVGGGLAVVGVAMQALVRNPLAEPYVLGISTGASAGASLFYMGMLPAFLTVLTLPVAAFAGGLASISIVFLVARTRGNLSVTRLLLAGIAMSALMGSITSFVTFASPDPNRIRAVLFWLLGSMSNARWDSLIVPALASLVGITGLLACARPMDAMLLGEEPAHSLGFDVERLKKVLLLLSTLITGVMVAASGAIGFVGLIVPHAVRSVVGVSHRKVLPISFVAGGTFLVLADLIGRSVLPAQELPVGIVTGICGVPFFLVLLAREQYRFG